MYVTFGVEVVLLVGSPPIEENPPILPIALSVVGDAAALVLTGVDSVTGVFLLHAVSIALASNILNTAIRFMVDLFLSLPLSGNLCIASLVAMIEIFTVCESGSVLNTYGCRLSNR